MMAGRPSVTRSQVVLLSATTVRLVLSVLVTAILGRLLAPADFGFFALVAAVFVVATDLIDLGTSSVTVRETVRDPTRERALLEGLMGWRRLCSLFIAGALVAAALMHDDAQRRWVLLGAASVLALLAPAALYPPFHVRQAQEGPALLAVGSQAFVLAGVVGLWALRTPGAVFAWLLVLREAVTFAGLRALASRLVGFRPRAVLRGRGLPAFLAMSLVYGVAFLMHGLYFHVDVFLVRGLRGEAELGAYAAAYRPINPALTTPWLLVVPLLPVLSAAARAHRGRFVRQAGGAAELMLGIGATGAVAGALLAPELLEILYGGNYLAGDLAAVSAFRWLSLAVGIVWVTSVFATALLADGREKVLLAICAAGLLVNVVGNLVFIPRYGFTAAAVTTAATELLVGATVLAVFVSTVGRRPRVKPAWIGFLLPAAGLGAILAVVGGSAPLRVGVGVAVGGAAVLALLASPAGRSHRRLISIDREERS